jgi:putative component of membrane protein insertase Oxa1/YidC/SpoIIIJ protein YidD
MKNYWILFLLTCSLGAEPWGKDADMVPRPPPVQVEPTPCRTPVLGPIAECLIRFHKEVISPADGPRSHHRPNSSQYMLDAIRKYGFFEGVPLGCDRLMRENNDPWIYPVITVEDGNKFKWDPVK